MDIFTCFNKQGGVNDNPSRLYSIVFTLEKVRNSFLLSKDSKIQIHLKPSSGRLLFSKAGHHGWRRHRISVLSLWFLSKTKCDR